MQDSVSVDVRSRWNSLQGQKIALKLIEQMVNGPPIVQRTCQRQAQTDVLLGFNAMQNSDPVDVCTPHSLPLVLMNLTDRRCAAHSPPSSSTQLLGSAG
jgi:hypothetical protein